MSLFRSAPIVLLAASLAQWTIPHAFSADPASSPPPRDQVSPMDALYRDRIEALASNVLAITVFDQSIDLKTLGGPEIYSIQSTDDPAYGPEKAVHPASISLRRRVARLSDRFDLMLKPTTIFLTLPTPLKNGCTYRVATKAVELLNGLTPVTFDDQHQLCDAIKINQLGYLPAMSKRAYIGLYMGGAGPMPITARRFELLDATDKPAFAGELKRRTIGEDLVGQELWEADFSAFDRPGNYRLRVPGMGVSSPFVIAADAYNPAYGNLLRGNFHQRCGQAIPAAWSRFNHDECHIDDALVTPDVAKLKFVNPKNPPLYEADQSIRQRTCVHGHHDAGDYGKYTISGAGYVFAILHAMEVFPDRFQDEHGILLPSSRSGIPDLLDEVKWELDWLASMQDTDGGVFGVIRPKNGGYENHLPPAKSGRLLFPKDTAFTAAYAAALAKAARSPAIQKHFPNEAKAYLEQARKAWAWLEKNPRFVEYFHYGAIFGDRDERCWAAAELFLATSDDTFAQYLRKNFDPAQKRWGWWALFESQGYAVMSLAAATKDPGENLAMRCKAELKSTCDALVEWSEANPYRLSFPPSSIQHKSFGWFFPGEMAGYPLLMGYSLSGDKRYLQCALDNLSYSMGTNATGHFLFSGLGHKRNIEIVHDPSKHDDIAEPSPGIPLGIGSSGLYFLNRYGKRPGEGQHPAEWPLLHRWYDGFNVQTEFTTPQLAKETVVAAYFASMPQPVPAAPKIAIKQQSIKDGPDYRIRFSLDVQGGAQVRQVFWDFDDESFSTAAAPVHVFTNPGRHHRVAATIVDAAGQWAWAQTTVVVPLERPAYRRDLLPADPKILARFAFDGQFTDDNRKLQLTAKDGGVFRRPFRFDPAASWMSQPAGQVLTLRGNEQFALELPDEFRKSLFDKGLYIDAIIYVDQFVTRGFPGDPILLGIKQKWDSWAGIQQGTWDRESGPAFKGGKATFIPAAELSAAFPRHRWCQVRLECSPAGGCKLLIDGKPVGGGGAFSFAPLAREPLIFSIGPWSGMVDDLVIGSLQ